MCKTYLSVAVLSVGLSGCSTASIPPVDGGDFIPVSSILNGVRCEFASFALRNPNAPFLKGPWQISGELEVKIVNSSQATAGADAKIAALGGSPLTLNFGFGWEHTSNTTRKTTFKFSINSQAPMRPCERITPNGPFRSTDAFPVINGLGFENWLQATYAQSTNGAQLNGESYEYGVDFGATSKLSGNAGIELVPVTVSAAGFNKRDDVQSLDISIVQPSPRAGPIRIELTQRVASVGGTNLQALRQPVPSPATIGAVIVPQAVSPGTSDIGEALRQAARARRRP
ncbi:hypothetical protein E8L99_13340 [Phreatobacter aquaticus]|uniref:Uncharacterized protein n=1 Tax=Phreatobacter aquaticus TaxID=2570229 RepID=A0A4D7QRF8_9HYPH|nr:hypothetical protein [Phreatobacter aquaticus]QCK86672.1 hypothetical protein E8L99_13340 [Phreatobacter aquaticus]